MNIKLELGKTYRNRKGEVRTIEFYVPGAVFCFIDNKGDIYTDQGNFGHDGKESQFDLIELVED